MALAECHRKIIHVDMDAFYAAVEQRDFPELRGKAIAVGGGSKRGVVCTASYEARKFGVRSAMAGAHAKELCPDLIFIKPRFDEYKKASRIIRDIFHEYTDLVEPLSLDEAYLDVTENKHGIPYATQVAKDIRRKICERTQLTASAGVSYNKFLAKIASDIHKPNGMKVILPDDAQAFLDALKIEKFHGIGRVTAKKMHALGIYSGADLKTWSKEDLHQRFGKSGVYYYHIVRGQDNRVVNPNRIRKSISIEHTFQENLQEKDKLITVLEKMSQELEMRADKAKACGSTVTLKVKFSDFTMVTRRITVDYAIAKAEKIEPLALHLLDKVDLIKPVRLLGLGLSNLSEDAGGGDTQLKLSLRG